MEKDLSFDKVREYYNDIIRMPLYVHTLKLKERLNVLEYAFYIEDKTRNRINGLIDCNPDYDYPAEYLPDKKFEYWNEHSPEHRQSIQVINEIDKSLPKNKKFRNIYLSPTKEPVKAEIPETPEIKPIFNPDQFETIYDLLKDYFSRADQTVLKKILKTGNNTPTPITFLSNGNRLADAFKELINKNFITGCNKKELEAWIQKNFYFLHRKKIKEFTRRYLNDIISTTKPLCKNQILVVKKDKTTGKYLISKP